MDFGNKIHGRETLHDIPLELTEGMRHRHRKNSFRVRHCYLKMENAMCEARWL